MFTGIVEELGTVAAIEDQGDALRLTVRATTALEGTILGDSIAVNGCCLTVAATAGDTWTADVMQETLDMTSLAGVAPGDRVNLERAVTADKRLGGHLVQGHVDGVGTVVRRDRPASTGTSSRCPCRPTWPGTSSPRARSCVDGVSLTVVDVGADSFTVSLIPETLARTTLGTRQPGDRVNLETDVIARHVEKLMTAYLPYPQEPPP